MVNSQESNNNQRINKSGLSYQSLKVKGKYLATHSLSTY